MEGRPDFTPNLAHHSYLGGYWIAGISGLLLPSRVIAPLLLQVG